MIELTFNEFVLYATIAFTVIALFMINRMYKNRFSAIVNRVEEIFRIISSELSDTKSKLEYIDYRIEILEKKLMKGEKTKPNETPAEENLSKTIERILKGD